MRRSKVSVMAAWKYFVRYTGFADRDGIATAIYNDCVSADAEPDYQLKLPLPDDLNLGRSVANSSACQ